MTTSIIPTEEQEQEAFCRWLDLQGYEYWHTPNSTFTKSWKQKNKNSRLGVKAGIPDLFVIIPNGECMKNWAFPYRLVAVEMKRQKGGVVSPYQVAWSERLGGAGVECVVARGANQAIDFILERVEK